MNSDSDRPSNLSPATLGADGSAQGHPTTALVTGGAGFIGSHLVRELLQSGQHVVVFDNLSTGTLAHLQLDHPNLVFIQGDIVDTQSLRKAFVDCQPQTVWHLAALHFIPYCNSHPTETIRVNVMGTQHVTNCCLEFGVRELIYTSSAAVYPVADRAFSEEDPPSPSDVYGITKLAGEMLLAAFHEGSGIRCIIARLFNIYGSGETNWHVIPEIVDQALKGNTVHLGNTNPKRDFIHVHDVVSALRSLAEARWINYGT
ncbi:MAG: NAD-dependent epimerase/dehydratase family protein, partial [Anaerolineales bacterium]